MRRSVRPKLGFTRCRCGIRRGWAGAIGIVREKNAHNGENYQVLTEEIVNRAGRTGGTFLHTSRTRPSRLPKALVPEHLLDDYTEPVNDLTPVLAAVCPATAAGRPPKRKNTDRFLRTGVRLWLAPGGSDGILGADLRC